MASIKSAFPVFVLSTLLAASAQADLIVPTPSSPSFLACDDASTGTNVGNISTIAKILCGTTSGTQVTKTGATFATLCELITGGTVPSTDFVVGSVIDLLAALQGTSPLTVFAPTDAAFAKNPTLITEINTLKTSNLFKYQELVLKILQLHVLPGTYTLEDLECDGVYDTVNLATTRPDLAQKSKTKCRSSVSKAAQIGGGNIGATSQPMIGSPDGVFTAAEFPSALGLDVTVQGFSRPTTVGGTFSANALACNGVIHVVDDVLLPGDLDELLEHGHGHSHSGKSGKSGKHGKSGKNSKKSSKRERELSGREENLKGRRHRLEALLKPNGEVGLN